MPISVEHERLRQAAVDLLVPDDFEGTAYDDITRRAAEGFKLSNDPFFVEKRPLD